MQSILHILLFAVCGIGVVLYLVVPAEFSSNLVRVLPKALAIITGEFNIGELLESGETFFGKKEWHQ